MNFDLTDDQLALQDGIREFCAGRFPAEVVRRFGEPGGFDRGAWAELAGMGTFGIALPETEGGVGLATIEAVLVYEVLGALVTPGPLTAATLAAPFVDGVLDGSVVPTVFDATEHFGGPIVVEHLPDADVLLVLTSDGVRLIEVSGLDAAAVAATRIDHPLDPTMSLALVESLPDGAVIADAATAARMRALGTLLTSAQLVGIAAESVRTAAAYAKDRIQFDRPVGSFQGLQFMLADAFAHAEVARASVHAAGVVFDDPEIDDVERALAGARVLAAAVAEKNVYTLIQAHGGIGFTWEFDAHLSLKRAWALLHAFGTADEAAVTVADRLVSATRPT